MNTTTNINKENFLVELHRISKLDLEDQIYGIFMNQEIFELVLSERDVELKLEPKDYVGATTPYSGIDVFYMPEEEKLLGGRKWFVVTQKQYDEYMAVIKALRGGVLFSPQSVHIE